MKITEVRVKMSDDPSDRLLAFCSVTIDESFVIRDLKIIDGASGPFVAMPSRRLTDKCRKCGFKNHMRARFCNDCGARLNENRAPRDEDGRVKLHADVAHPINAECRDAIEEAVIEAYNREVDLCEDPNYVAKEDNVSEFDADEIEVEPGKNQDRGGMEDFIEEVREAVGNRSGSNGKSSTISNPTNPKSAMNAKGIGTPASKNAGPALMPSKQMPPSEPVRQSPPDRPIFAAPTAKTQVPQLLPKVLPPAQESGGFAAGLL